MQVAQTMWQILEIYSDLFPLEKNHLLSQTHYVRDLPDPFARSTLPGHITGSGIVIVDQKMLLIHHRYMKEWFQPGGHVDPGETPDTCAIREVTEETGWHTAHIAPHQAPLPIDIEMHLIPANPIKQEKEHWHIDFAYLLEPIHQGLASDPEVCDWFDIQSLQAPRLARVVQKYYERLK